MIRRIECYEAICDVCGESVYDGAELNPHYDTEAEALEIAIESDEYGGGGANIINDKLCCPSCWTYGDNDEPEIRVKEDK